MGDKNEKNNHRTYSVKYLNWKDGVQEFKRSKPQEIKD